MGMWYFNLLILQCKCNCSFSDPNELREDGDLFLQKSFGHSIVGRQLPFYPSRYVEFHLIKFTIEEIPTENVLLPAALISPKNSNAPSANVIIESRNWECIVGTYDVSLVIIHKLSSHDCFIIWTSDVEITIHNSVCNRCQSVILKWNSYNIRIAN